MIPAAVLVLGLALPQAPEFERQLEAIRARHGVPALAAVVLARGGVQRLAAVGVRRIGTDDAVTAADAWHVGSCGKPMTAAALARLVAAGRLRWDTALGELFPERRARWHPGFAAVTVRQLVDHRSGLPRCESAGREFAALARGGATPTAQRLLILDEVLGRAPAAAPGPVCAYANTGYWIAGAVIERVTGECWWTAMQSLVFGPLGMTSAVCGPPEGPWGHATVLGRTIAFDPASPLARLPSFYGPAGDVSVTLADWARFATAFLDGTAPHAAGWSVTSQPGVRGPVLAHTGASGRWRAAARLAPEERLAVLAACNHGGAPAAAALREVAERWFAVPAAGR